MDITTVTHHIRHTYTPDEKVEISMKMVNSMQVIEEKQEILSDFSKKIKGEIVEQEKIIDECASKIRTGFVTVEKECIVKYDYANRSVIFIEKETGEVVETRPMSDEEQLRFSGDGEKNEDNEGGDSSEE
jgi:hypothetical protein